MICMLNKKATNNEEYRAVVKSRIRFFVGWIILGIFTFAVAICNEIINFIPDNYWLNGLYTGLGSSMVAVGIIRIIRFKKLLKNEEQLKADRLRNTDERNIMISLQATRSAMLIVMVFCYIVLIISGFFSRTVFYCFWSVIMVFLFSYVGIWVYLSRKL